MKKNHLSVDIFGELKPVPSSFKIGNLFYLYYRSGFFWFRFFSKYGLWGRSNKIKSPVLFSERYSYKKFVRIFGWKFRILKP